LDPTSLSEAQNSVSGENARMKLSVMMITYNHERFITHAIESVLAQRVNFDYEIVIGEDCSTDGTRAVITDFHRRYPGRIVPRLRDQNIGVMRNLEATLAACRGRYLALLEGDDYWTCDEKLQRQVDFLDTHPGSSMCCHRVQFLNETGFAEADVFPSLPAGPYTIEDLLKDNFVMTCSAVLRRDLIPTLPPWFREMKLGDWPMFALAARHGTIELMDEVMSVYRKHQGGVWSSLSSVSRSREIVRMLKALDKHLDFQYTNAMRPTIGRCLAHSYLGMASIARQAGNRIETAKHLAVYLRSGGLKVPGSRRAFASLAAYTLFGSWYEAIRKARRASRSS
jgi:glycosyltransferase involved in cell wall biosynthesis